MIDINFIVLPYRDRYFLDRYGNAVRDLHIVQALSSKAGVAVSAFNRPVSLPERLLLMKRWSVGTKPHAAMPTVTWVDSTDPSLIGPLQRRRWVSRSYLPQHEAIAKLKRAGSLNVLLDFTPMAVIDYKSLACDVVWYDAIDNFTKHNRFSAEELELVRRKYLYVSQNADVITAVSPGAIDCFGGSASKLVLPNGLPLSAEVGIKECKQDAYDFGFMGFVTDKFDVSLVRQLSDRGYSIGIYGAVYDQATATELASISSVHLHGAFEYRDASEISAGFKVGLVPYIRSKLHDESPLKLYQYLSWGKPVISSIEYEVSSPFIHVYDDINSADLGILAESAIRESQDTGTRAQICSSVDDSSKWEFKIESVIGRILDASRNSSR